MCLTYFFIFHPVLLNNSKFVNFVATAFELHDHWYPWQINHCKIFPKPCKERPHLCHIHYIPVRDNINAWDPPKACHWSVKGLSWASHGNSGAFKWPHLYFTLSRQMRQKSISFGIMSMMKSFSLFLSHTLFLLWTCLFPCLCSPHLQCNGKPWHGVGSERKRDKG